MLRGATLTFAALVLLVGCGGGHKAVQAPPSRTVKASDPVRRAPPPIRRLVPVAAGNLANAIQDAAAAPYNGGAVLIGGLTPADVSSDEIVTATRAGSRRVGRIPGALHDSAAVTIGASSYLFGGGTGVAQIDTILMVDARTGAAQVVGHLPAGSSDQSAAAIGHTAYIVGGYTGTRWLDTIVAWSPGGHARVVAHLPHTLRYAAVTAAAGKLVVAGGSLENGTASDAVYAFSPATRTVTRIGAPARTDDARRRGGDRRHRVRDRRPQCDGQQPDRGDRRRRPVEAHGARHRHAAAAALGSRGGGHERAASCSPAATAPRERSRP